jgi:hypothetical protein
MSSAITAATKELNLEKRPTIKIEHGSSDYVMAATGVVYSQGFLFNKIITHTECDYVLHINQESLNKLITEYTVLFCNKQAAYDAVYLLVCHELRHMWQYQTGTCHIGKPCNQLNFTEMFDGHGAADVEIDANNWMLMVASRKNINELAQYMELTQRVNGLSNYNKEFADKVHAAYIQAAKNYNKPLKVALRIKDLIKSL